VALLEPRLLHDFERAPERVFALFGKPDDDVSGAVEVREALELREVVAGGVATPHRAKNAVVSGLQGHVQMRRCRRCLA